MNIEGFLIVNKPGGISSFDCVRHIKRIVNEKVRIGHSGTLDEFAEGLMIIALGRTFTRRLNHLMVLDKEYLAEAKLGELRDTLDYTGSIIKIDRPDIKKRDIVRAIEGLGDEYCQIPPVYSALKYKGAPLYKLAREKKLSVEEMKRILGSKSRSVKIDIKLLEFSYPFFTFKAKVSKGGYIRSLANDILLRLGSCATVYYLKRIKIGRITINDAVDLYSLKNLKDIQLNLRRNLNN